MSPEEQYFILNKAYYDLSQMQKNAIEANRQNFHLLNRTFHAIDYKPPKGAVKEKPAKQKVKQKPAQQKSTGGTQENSKEASEQKSSKKAVKEDSNKSTDVEALPDSVDKVRQRTRLKALEEKKRYLANNKALYERLLQTRSRPRQENEIWKRHVQLKETYLEDKKRARELCEQQARGKDARDRQILDKYELRVAQIKMHREVEAKKLDLKNAKSSQFVDCADFIDIVKKLSEYDVGSINICPPCSYPCEPCSCDESIPSEVLEVEDIASSSGSLGMSSDSDMSFSSWDFESEPNINVVPSKPEPTIDVLSTYRYNNGEQTNGEHGLKLGDPKTDNRVQKSGRSKKRVRFNNSKKEKKLDSSKNELKLNISKNQKEFYRSKKQNKLGSSEKQVTFYSPKNEKELDSSKNQKKINISTNQSGLDIFSKNQKKLDRSKNERGLNSSKKQKESGSSKKKLKFYSSKNQKQLNNSKNKKKSGSSKKQLKFYSSKNQKQLNNSKNQKKLGSSKNEIKLNSSKNQIEFDSSKNQKKSESKDQKILNTLENEKNMEPMRKAESTWSAKIEQKVHELKETLAREQEEVQKLYKDAFRMTP